MPGERVDTTFSGDEDDWGAPPPPKKRKAVTKKAAVPKQTASKGTSMVGRKKIRQPRANRSALDAETDDEDEEPDKTLPSYLQDRRKERDEQQKDETNSTGLGFLLPPSYDDTELDDNTNLADLEERPQLPGITPPAPYEDIFICDEQAIIPAPIAQYLSPYQVVGAEFLYKKYFWQQGGILGDDMGLGKTIQVIAFLAAAFGKTGDTRDLKRMRTIRSHHNDRFYPRVLLICPGGLMSNWQTELERWGYFHTYTCHGSPANKADALAAAEKGSLEIMITTYDSYRLNESAINSIRWDCVVADECHKIKERKAEITKTMNNVNALCRLGLSGTAIQNKYEELWTLLNWANPGKLGPIASWKSAVCMPLKLGQSHDATNSQLAKARRIADQLSKILLPRMFLRRTKALIAHQLPKKSDRVVFCPLTETQADAYNNFCDHELVHAIRDHANPCNCGSGLKQGSCCMQEVEGFGKWQHHVFPVLVMLQKLSNHLGLLLPSGEADRDRHDHELEKLQIALPDLWKELYRKRDSLLTHANHEYCGKWKVLKKLLRFWHDNGDKVLIFSHSVRLLKMLKILFATTDYNFSYLDGSMSYQDRVVEVDKYNSNPSEFVFLISTKAGGVGLNITSANKVVVMDPNWNPAYDLQAQDRAYRIGQKRDVEVFRLVSVGTVEEIVYARQIYKQQQANIGYDGSIERRYFKGVQDQKDQKGEIFGLSNLFAPLQENIVLRDIVNKTNVAETRAGVEIAGLEHEAAEEDDEAFSSLSEHAREDAAMSELANSIIGNADSRRKAARETAKKKDPVQAILASAGVEYTHENAEVIGTSKIEKQISSRAQKAENDTDHINELAFARGEEREDRPSVKTEMTDEDAVDLDDGLGKIRYKWRPPVDVRKRQFCTMARQLGYDDVTEFALVVEGWTQEQRRDFLEKFYIGRRASLAPEA